MGNIVHFTRKKVQAPAVIGKVHKAITVWLDSRPAATKKGYLCIARSWSKYLGVDFDGEGADEAWTTATPTDVQGFINEIKKRPAQSGRARLASPDGKVSIATVAYKVVVLKSIYEQLMHCELVTKNVFAKSAAELKKHKPGKLRPHERMPGHVVRALINMEATTRSEARDRMIFVVALGAALRRSEIRRLKINDVELTTQGTVVLKLRQTKSGTPQQLSLPDWVGEQVQQFKESRIQEGAGQEDYLFVRYADRKTYPIGDEWIYNLFIKYCKKFGFEKVYTPHCCRVTAITQMLDQGFSHREVQELSRHSSVQLVERYDRKRNEVDQSPSKKLKYDD